MKGFIQAQVLGYVMNDIFFLGEDGVRPVMCADVACSPYDAKPEYRMYVNARFRDKNMVDAGAILRRGHWVFLTGRLRAAPRTRARKPVGTYVDMEVDRWQVIFVHHGDANPKKATDWPDIVDLPEKDRPKPLGDDEAQAKIQQGLDQIEKEREDPGT